ncbi:MAG: tetratricopeptide repeat protein [bacterium]
MPNLGHRFTEGAQLWAEGKYRKAMAVYQTLLHSEALPDVARAILCEYLARLHVGLNDLTTAEDFLRRAVALDPDGVDHHVHLANCLCLAGRDEEAWQLIRRLYRRHPEHPLAIHYLGKMLDDRGQHRKGLVLMKKAVHLDPNNERLLSDLAFSYMRQGNAGAAMVCSEQAMVLNANDQVVRFVHALVSTCERPSRARQERPQLGVTRRQRNRKTSLRANAKREVK